MKDHVKCFSDFLSSKELKLTKPRRAILDAVFELHEHFDAEQLYERLKGITKDVSRATIYRTLPLLLEAGLIQQSGRNASRDVYEHIYGHPRHIHWVCEKCNTVMETDLEELLPSINKSARRMKFAIEDLMINIRGICWKCNENENQ
ncbi:MAG: Fur family transcriptional regulator [Candidatus Cloacimonadaceae bacterium]|nr:Fur family transcriptional regulator [Candidatus Cloacimonadaceae bacterium]